MRHIAMLLILVLLASHIQAQRLYLHCGQLIDVRNQEVQSKKTIIVDGKRIVDIRNGYVAPENGEVIDLSNKTVMPGLIDMHVHLESETSEDHYIKRFTLNDADVAFRSALYAKRTLMAGFTSVRDLGGRGVNTSLGDAIEKGFVIGPRVFSSGKSIATTGGHADPTNGYRKELMGIPEPRDGVINGPYEAREAVRQRYKNGADVIKITITGGVLSVAKSGHNPQFFEDEVKAIVETANDYDMLTAAHAHGDEGMQRAIKAGIKTIEHGTMMSEATMELMKQNDAYYVPTITAGKAVAEYAEIEGYYPEMVVPKAKTIGSKIHETFKKAYGIGVPIAFGTDAGVFPHGENGREFVYMTEAGMPILEAIKTATIIPAKLLKIDDQLGSLEKDKLADIIAVNNDPRQKVETMKNVAFVMKEGKVYKR